MQAEPIKANLKFLANVDGPLVYIPSKGGGDATEHVGNFTMQEVSVHDGRHEKQSSSLDIEGFRLMSHETAVEDFYDDAQIESTYHDEVKALLIKMTGAARIEIFDDTRRSSLSSNKEKRRSASLLISFTMITPLAPASSDCVTTSPMSRMKRRSYCDGASP